MRARDEDGKEEEKRKKETEIERREKREVSYALASFFYLSLGG